MQNSMPLYADVAEATAYAQRALMQMPVRSSTLARKMVAEHLPVPETTGEIECYVRLQLTHKEQLVCDMATD